MSNFGAICKNHPSANGERASNGVCVHCKREAGREWHKANKARIAEAKKAKYAANAENERAKRKLWRAANPEKRIEATARTGEWRRNNPEKTKIQRTKYRISSPEKHCAKQARYRASKLRATPIWANQFCIQEAYVLAKQRSTMTGVDWHVDHVVPLRSEIVCGLHTDSNLRVILGKDNQAKGNKYWPMMPDVAGRSWEKVKGAAA